jgi:hypothetical protein
MKTEVVMSSKQRLENVQAELVKRGAKDVKFFFGKLSELAPSELMSDAADAFEAYLAGRHKKCAPFGDSLREIKA